MSKKQFSKNQGKLHWFSLANQLRFGFTFLVIASLGITGSMLIYTSFQDSLRALYWLQHERSENASEKISSYLEDLQEKLSYLARVRGLTDLPANTREALLEGLIRHNSAYEQIAIINNKAQVVTLLSPFGENFLDNQAKSHLFTMAFKQQEDYVGDVEVDEKTGQLFTRLAFPIRNQADQVDGVLVAKINLRFLEFVVNQTRVGETGYTYVIDERHFLIAQKLSGKLDQRTKSFQLEDISQRPFIQNLTDLKKPKLSTYQGLRGIEVIGAIAQIKEVNWAVIVELPTIEAYGPIYQLILTMSSALFIATLIAIAIGFIISQKVVVPLQKLSIAATEISQGNWYAQVEIKNQNELGLLARTFNKMAQQLAEFYQSLELKVKERTTELMNVNQTLENEIVERKQAEAELQEALNQLQATQFQLIQAEKMSSLGQLVAGIAHEINNPVNFIHGNLDHTNEYTMGLLELISIYQKYYPEPPLEVQEKTEEIDLEFIGDDLPKLLKSMKLGTDRIREIVLSLRNFSRLDEADMKAVNIHEGIESTLLILYNRFKAGPDQIQIEIVKEYGELPLVECYAGQLNQVFMNILANAIDALETQRNRSANPDSKLPKITIKTQLINHAKVLISIADNGAGIPEAVKTQIFNPFFTTKPVGKGTGLGLSISYQIVVEKHGGELRCISSPETGTEFLIELPLVATKPVK